jgi:hypothetical protein
MNGFIRPHYRSTPGTHFQLADKTTNTSNHYKITK